MRAQLKVPVLAVSERSDAVEGADIIVTATPADTPQFPGHMVGPGVFVASLGSHEVLEPGLLRRASMIVVDSLTQSKARGALAPLFRSDQLLDNAAMTELGAIVAGLKPGRQRWDETIVACLTGLASADVALAAHIYEAARRRKRGMVFRFLE
jgi:ornithine cyclodeaminase